MLVEFCCYRQPCNREFPYNGFRQALFSKRTLHLVGSSEFLPFDLVLRSPSKGRESLPQRLLLLTFVTSCSHLPILSILSLRWAPLSRPLFRKNKVYDLHLLIIEREKPIEPSRALKGGAQPRSDSLKRLLFMPLPLTGRFPCKLGTATYFSASRRA